MKLSKYAKETGISYKTAWKWFKEGKISGYQMDTGTIIITEFSKKPSQRNVALYARVSSHENKKNLDSQVSRLSDYCCAKGWTISKVVKEIGSGINDNRKKLLSLLKDESITIIVVEHKDRLTRFGFNYIETLLTLQNRKVEIVNQAENEKTDLIEDLVSIIYSFCVRLYGTRKAKRKSQEIKQELEK